MSLVSFSNTPQAVDDTYSYLEDQLGLLTSGSLVILDVMADDLGGKAKTLFSIDDGSGNPLNLTDLLNADGLVNGVSAWETTASGNLVRINNGKLELDLSHDLAAIGGMNINSLAAGDYIHDTFVYAIRLGNGTLSWAHVTFDVYGQNDAATISGDTAGALSEDDTTPVTGTLTVADPDHDQSHTQAITNAASLAGLGSYSVDAGGNWSYTVDNAAVQYLGTGESTTDSFVVSSLDGTAQETVTVTINGADDVLTFSRTDYAAGAGPISVAVADLNGDGNLDFAVANGNSFNDATIWLGNGTGSVTQLANFAVGESHEVKLVDFNGDSILDMVNANSNSSTVSVSLGNGDGTFGTRTQIPAGSRPIATAEADINGDGKMDIVTANYGSDDVSVLLGNGNGTFQGPLNFAAGVQPGSIALADFNEDGKIDVAAGNQVSATVSVLLGNGDARCKPSLSWQSATLWQLRILTMTAIRIWSHSITPLGLCRSPLGMATAPSRRQSTQPLSIIRSTLRSVMLTTTATRIS